MNSVDHSTCAAAIGRQGAPKNEMRVLSMLNARDVFDRKSRRYSREAACVVPAGARPSFDMIGSSCVVQNQAFPSLGVSAKTLSFKENSGDSYPHGCLVQGRASFNESTQVLGNAIDYKHHSAISKLEQEKERLQQEIDRLENEIDRRSRYQSALKYAIDFAGERIRGWEASMQSMQKDGVIQYFNSLRDQFSALVNQYNSKVMTFNKMIDKYNEKYYFVVLYSDTDMKGTSTVLRLGPNEQLREFKASEIGELAKNIGSIIISPGVYVQIRTSHSGHNHVDHNHLFRNYISGDNRSSMGQKSFNLNYRNIFSIELSRNVTFNKQPCMKPLAYDQDRDYKWYEIFETKDVCSVSDA